MKHEMSTSLISNEELAFAYYTVLLASIYTSIVSVFWYSCLSSSTTPVSINVYLSVQDD